MSTEKTFSELVGESLGRASMAWSEVPTGIFDSDKCLELQSEIVNAHRHELKASWVKHVEVKVEEILQLREDLEFMLDNNWWALSGSPQESLQLSERMDEMRARYGIRLKYE